VRGFYLHLEKFKMAFILASRGLGGRLDNIELKLIRILDNLSRGGFNTTHINIMPNPQLGTNAVANSATCVQA
jgi:hypothetical protein